MEKLKYSVAEDGLKDKEITEIVDNYKDKVVPEVQLRNEYAKGNNPFILKRRIPKGSPNNQTPVSYGRRMINLVTGYMYKPGLITYGSDNEEYLKALQEVFDYNNEPLQTEQMGRQTSIQGQGYELFFYEGVGQARDSEGVPAPAKAMPRFVKVPLEQIITIYNYDIVPQLTHFIRFYSTDTEEEYIDVYDTTNIYSYLRKKHSKSLDNLGTAKHYFDRVPLVVYENNEDLIGDFSCVVPLINAYDVLMSDSLNEFDRFAWAYLIMRGFFLSDEQREQVKHKRAFQLLNKEDDINFLTKDINADFIRFMSEWVRGEIHRQSGIPNLDDYKFGGQVSGETVGKWIYLMELFTDPKESYFRQALKKRIEMITDNAKFVNGDPADIDIVMSRNAPDKSMEQAELLEKYSPFISRQTGLKEFADFVDNVEEELERRKAEQEEAMVDLDRFGGQEEEETEEEEEK